MATIMATLTIRKSTTMLIVITTSQVTTTAKEALITIRKNIITTALKVMVLRAIASKVTVLDPADLLTATLDQTTVDFGSKFI